MKDKKGKTVTAKSKVTHNHSIVELPKMRPYTITGLCLYLGCNSAYFRQFRKDCDKDFSTIITRIEEVIYTQKFEGAASGFLNPSIIARDLGLIEKKDVTSDGEKLNDLSNIEVVIKRPDED